MVIHNIQFLQGDHDIMGDNDNTPDTAGSDTTGATSPEEVVEQVRDNVQPAEALESQRQPVADAAPVENAPTPDTESTSDDSSTPDN